MDSPVKTSLHGWSNRRLSHDSSTWVRNMVFGGAFCMFLFLFFYKNAQKQYILCSESNNIYTIDESLPRVQCISVSGSQIVDRGTLNDIMLRRERKNPILPSWLNAVLLSVLKYPRVVHIDPSAIVVPGFADAHAHIIENGWMMQLPLQSTNSIKDVVDKVEAYILAHPDIHRNTSRWVEGMGWDQTRWEGGQFPRAQDLAENPLLSGRPISLTRVDGHAKWVSPRVLELMGDLPSEVEGGTIVRDDNGYPTGIFIDNAMGLIPAPSWDDDQLSQFFNNTMTQALSYGLTSIHDAGASPDQIHFFMKQAEKGKLPNRLYVMGKVDSNEYWGPQIPRLTNYGRDGRLNVRSIKLVADGALGSWGAAMLQPYTDNPNEEGKLLIPEDTLRSLVRKFWKDGWGVNVHCIGDRANNVVLDIFEEILTQNGGNVSTWRPRIEHAQIMTQDDLKRMTALGVIASVQPTHGTSDMRYAEARIGPDRIKGSYAFQTLLQASPLKVLPLGSDFPIEGVNPLLGFYAAVTRLDVNGWSPHGPGGWYQSEKLTRMQALKGMTLDASYASFSEDRSGSLEQGKQADFVVLDRDIMTIAATEILGTKVIATVVDGQVVYGKFI